MNLREPWNQNWQELGLAPKTEMVERLLASYSEAGRFYHTVQHLEECFAYLDHGQNRRAMPSGLAAPSAP